MGGGLTADSSSLRRTSLYPEHIALGARIVPFAGWEMPLQFAGIVEEHHAVRRRAGLFDVSHMGRLTVEGPDAAAFLRSLCTYDVTRIGVGEGHYAVVCREDGGILDDIYVFRPGEERFLVVVNASNAPRIGEWARAHLPDGSRATLVDRQTETAMLALQGPEAPSHLEALAPGVARGLAARHCAEVEMQGTPRLHLAHRLHRRGRLRAGGAGRRRARPLAAAARTRRPALRPRRPRHPAPGGRLLYGNDIDLRRVEIGPAFSRAPATPARTASRCVPRRRARPLAAAVERGVQPCGLGARDTLRLEAALALYGNDIDESTNPFEAGLGWTVTLDDGADFVGREALLRIHEAGVDRQLACLKALERGVMRAGCPLLHGGRPVGRLTSGGFSPTLGVSIGMGYLPPELAAAGTELDVDVRGKPLRAQVVPRPFYKRPQGGVGASAARPASTRTSDG